MCSNRQTLFPTSSRAAITELSELRSQTFVNASETHLLWDHIRSNQAATSLWEISPSAWQCGPQLCPWQSGWIVYWMWVLLKELWTQMRGNTVAYYFVLSTFFERWQLSLRTVWESWFRYWFSYLLGLSCLQRLWVNSPSSRTRECATTFYVWLICQSKYAVVSWIHVLRGSTPSSCETHSQQWVSIKGSDIGRAL